MNAPFTDDQDIGFDRASSQANNAAIDSPGRALHDARRARKLETVRIANELRLSPETIDSLERDDFEHLPSAVFVAGYIRTYARLLELDPEPLIARFRELHPGAEAPPRVALRASRPTPKPGSSDKRISLTPILLTLVLLVAIAAASYLWFSGNGWFSGNEWISNDTEDPASAKTAPDTAPFSASVDPAPYEPDTTNLGEAEFENAGRAAPASPSNEPKGEDSVSVITDTSPSDSLMPATDQADPTSRPAQLPRPETREQTAADMNTGVELLPPVTQEQSGPADSGAAGEVSETEPQADATSINTQVTGEVVATFSGPCWVDIRDAEGQVLLFGEMAAGDRRVLDGDPPYSLVLGNAAATELTVGGKPFDLRTIAKGNVARFTLDPAEFDPAEGEPSTNGD